MKCGLELTKIVLLATVFLPGFACASEHTEEDPTAWNKLTSEMIHTVPTERLQEEASRLEAILQNARHNLATFTFSEKAAKSVAEIMAFRENQDKMIQAELAKRTPSATSAASY